MDAGELTHQVSAFSLTGYDFTPLDLLSGETELCLSLSLSNLKAYCVVRGIDDLVDEIAVRFKAGSSSVLVTEGSSQGLLLSLLDHGESNADRSAIRVWLPDVCFPSYRYLADQLGFTTLSYDHRKLDSLDCLAGARDLVIVNTPHNPTGISYCPADIVSLANLADKVGFTVVLDLAYISQANNCWIDSYSGFCQTHENVVQTYSLSKILGAQGIRSGFILTSTERVKRLAVHKRMLAVSSSLPDQLATTELLRRFSPELLDSYRTEVLRRKYLSIEYLETVGIQALLHSENGSAFFLAKVPEFSEVGVPGRHFGASSAAYSRVCCATSIENFTYAIKSTLCRSPTQS